MKLDIRLIKLSSVIENGVTVFNRVGYSLEQAFVMGGELVPLVQAFVSNLLIDRGSDRLSVNRGGGLTSLARRHKRISNDLESEVRSAISSVELFMRNEQQYRTMDPKERLASAQLISVSSGNSPDEINIEILLRAESGDAVALTL